MSIPPGYLPAIFKSFNYMDFGNNIIIHRGDKNKIYVFRNGEMVSLGTFDDIRKGKNGG